MDGWLLLLLPPPLLLLAHQTRRSPGQRASRKGCEATRSSSGQTRRRR